MCPSTSKLPFASILPVNVAVPVNSEVPATLKLVPFNNCKLSLLNLPVIVCEPALTVSYTHLRAHETSQDLVCRLLLEKKNN